MNTTGLLTKTWFDSYDYKWRSLRDARVNSLRENSKYSSPMQFL